MPLYWPCHVMPMPHTWPTVAPIHQPLTTLDHVLRLILMAARSKGMAARHGALLR